MEVEVLEIRDHMGQHPPFDMLSDDELDELAGQVEVTYFRAGTQILELHQDIADLYYIRSGAVEVFRPRGELYNRLSEGDIFGHFGLLRNRKVRFPARALEDSLIYLVPYDSFERMCAQNEQFAEFVEAEGPRLKATVEQLRRDNTLVMTRVRKLLTHAPEFIGMSETVQTAARQMRDNNVSALLVLASQGLGDQLRRLQGLLTEHDLVARGLSEGCTPETQVSELMTPNPVTIQSDESVYEAMLTMLRHNVHHLPVLRRREVVGMLHLSDIIRYETNSSLYLVNSIYHQTRLSGLSQLADDARRTFVSMVKEGADSDMVGSALSTIGRSFTRRLLELAEEELGPPPVPYCFMALGSMARNEQTIVTDQDNAMVLSDDYDPKQHREYFLTLAKRVSDGLNACGYPYCTGDVMATNDKWRQPLSVWREVFTDWIMNPNAEKLLHSSIFFDLDSVYGEEEFVESLKDLVVEMAPNHPKFLAALARNAINRTPPLGLFRNFVMEPDGRHRDTINLKRRGTAPLTDLIRVHALAAGSRAQNSFERLNDIGETRLLPEGVSERLKDALEFIAMMRIRHQVHNLDQGEEPNNSIRPDIVSADERHSLKAAFQALSNAQRFLQFRYRATPTQGGLK
ncbi:DUF294 nucleotidyltransferase-like domain-containing protein [Marinimicrobium sp. C2-29]|uniref:DUF294 nucleotidyltransferase-like domain-containing protein n=1 Tax=Marinimicrobium sp. C2-29 TaxID=3139825 RepID=UPI003139AA7D